MSSIEMASLNVIQTPGAVVKPQAGGVWRLEIPSGPKGRYRVAQLDDYTNLSRSAYLWKPPLRFSLRARACCPDIPGTWGFGLWNDPFGMALFSGAEPLRMPTLPNTAWFFFASEPNYLSFRDDLPASGALAATFRSPRLPALLLALAAAPAIPLALLPAVMRRLRKLARRWIQQDAAQLRLDPLSWHTYGFDWLADQVVFQLDGSTVLETVVSPLGPLGLVMWVDNQYAALPPGGKIGFGALENKTPAWIEIKDIMLDNPAWGV